MIPFLIIKRQQISPQQKDVVEALKSKNVVVDSVAGSGKTMTCMAIAEGFKDSKILLLTYNRRLKLETQQRVKKKDCIDDVKLKDAIIHNKIKPKKEIDFNLFIVDEAQDMNDLYYCTFLKILMDNQYQPNSFKIVILGDEMQSIYKYSGADSRFITLADRIYRQMNPFPWISLNLSQSFRVTHQIAKFMNNCMLSTPRIFSRKQGDKPIYLICKPFTSTIKNSQKSENEIYNQIQNLIKVKRYQPEDIFVLAPSIKNNKIPVGNLSNILSANSIPIFYPKSDEEQIDEEVIKSKIVFSSFHQVKGLERKVVIVFSFDSGYFKFFNKTAEKSKCTNELYVAVFRVLEQLILIQDEKSQPLPFLNIQRVPQFCQVIGNQNALNNSGSSDTGQSDNLLVSVSTLTRHISVNVMEQCLSLIDCRILQQQGEVINMSTKSSQEMKTGNGQYLDISESVKEITATAIPIYFEIKQLNKSSVLDLAIKYFNENREFQTNIFKNPDQILDKLEIMKRKQHKKNCFLNPSEILYLANLWNSINTNLNYKMNQIKDYSWLSENQMIACYNRFTNLVTKQGNLLQFQKKFQTFVTIGSFAKKIYGFGDCIDLDNKTFWEFKCVDELKGEHILQLALKMRLFFLEQEQEQQQLEKENEKKKPLDQNEDLIYHKQPTENIDCQFLQKNENKVQYLYNGKKYWGNSEDFSIKTTQIEDQEQMVEKQIENEPQQYSFKIFNIQTSEIQELTSNSLKLSEIFNILINSKYGKEEKKEDSEFIKKMQECETYRRALTKLQSQQQK